MTPPENPEDQQGGADQNAERTSVMTQPAAAGQEPGQQSDDSGGQETSGQADEAQATSDARTQRDASGHAAAEAGHADTGAGSEAAASEPTATGYPGAEEQAEESTEQVDTTASVPPPWQRVTSDAQYMAEHPTEQQQPAQSYQGYPGGQPYQAGQPGYQGAPADTGYGEVDPEATVVNQPALNQPGGTAAGHLFVGQQPGYASGGTGMGSGRTAVNLGSAGGRSGTAAGGTRRPGRGPRRASLQVKRVDPWSVLKLAGVLSVAMFFVWMVAVGVLYGVLDGMGVWDKLNGTYNDLVQGGSDAGGGSLISVGRVFGVAAVIGMINIVLFTALATVSAFIYNVSADLAGGLEVTLSERE